MTLRFELTIGWLSIVFEPSTYVDADEPDEPDEPEDTEPEPAKGSAQALDSSSWLGDSAHPPGDV